MALDDPEGWDLYRQIQDKARGDERIKLFTNLTGVGNIEVNAFQRLSSVILQKSIREGFGLVISEALWKGTPVVAGRAGGIPLQMADGTGGTLVDSVEEAAAAIVDLLHDRDYAAGSGSMAAIRSPSTSYYRDYCSMMLLNEIAAPTTPRFTSTRLQARARRMGACPQSGSGARHVFSNDCHA
jgi:glycosyltransferase involved in cell wall biosynthesis